jgi:hypothetical protein
MATTTRDDVLARLDQGIAALASSERWTAWLQVTWNRQISSSRPVETVESVRKRRAVDAVPQSPM